MAKEMVLKFENPSVGGEIEVISFSHESPASRTLTFTKYVDDASSDLVQMCWSAKQIGKATLRLRRDDGSGGASAGYLTIAMQQVLIGDYRVSGGAGDMPVETYTLECGSLSYDYRHKGPPA